MKREQLEKIVSAVAGLASALKGTGVETISASNGASEQRVAFHVAADEAVQALAAAAGKEAQLARGDGRWMLSAHFDFVGVRVNVFGPTHDNVEPADDAKVDAAIAHVEAAADDIAIDLTPAFVGTVGQLVKLIGDS